MQEYLSTVAAKKYLAENIVELAVNLVRPRAIRFRAGQFVFFKIGGAWKAYSIISPPEQSQQLKFCIKLEPGGLGSAFVRNLNVGDNLEFSGPEGYFYVSGMGASYIFLAAGIGIAPFVSMLPDLLSKRFRGRVLLIHVNASNGDALYSHLFRSLAGRYPAFQYLPVSNSGQKITAYLPSPLPLKKFWYYVCGSQNTVNKIGRSLLDAGVPEQRIRTEAFLFSDRPKGLRS